MPSMNMSRALSNPRTLDTFDVLRQEEFVNERGRNNLTVRRYPGIRGVWAPSGDNRLARSDDQGNMANTYSVVTSFELQGPSPGRQPDKLEWPPGSSDQYVVLELNDCSRYGPGFVEATVTAVTSQTQAPG